MTEPRFTSKGILITDSMLGLWDSYEVGSEKWAAALAAHIQSNYEQMTREGTGTYLVKCINTALNSSPRPWEVFPPQANGSPETWLRLIIGIGWDDLKDQLQRRDPQAWESVSWDLAAWEAEHRTDGRPTGETGSVASSCDERDHTQARGIRRRLQKRANDGDAEAQELVEAVQSGGMTVNQAAIAAGMRQKYIRLRTDDPAKAAASLLARLDEEWAAQLTAHLTQLLTSSSDSGQ